MFDRLRNRRSLMMYPALDAGRWSDILTVGADMVCLDLEDGTQAARKAEARGLCLPCFAGDGRGGPLRLLRINHPRSAEGMRDLLALQDAAALPDGVLIPKAEDPADVQEVAALLAARRPDIEIIPLIESPRGARQAAAIACAAAQVSALFLGSVDYSGELGSDMGWDALALVRGQLVAAAAEAGIDCIDGPWLDVDDASGLVEESRRVAAMGFTGKCSYDSVQLDAIHRAFTPSAAQVDHARRLVDAVRASPTGSARVDGRSANRANARGAGRLLALARRRGVPVDGEQA